MTSSSADLGWALRTPSGNLIAMTFGLTRDDAWSKSFMWLCPVDPDFKSKYWKKWEESQIAARRMGYKVVRARVVGGD